MCTEKLRFQYITASSPEKAGAETIYNEAFPESERGCSLDDLLAISEEFSCLKLAVVLSQEATVGFICFIEFEEYVYLLYFAVNSALRGGGYGSKLIGALQDAFREKPIICAIETPFPGTANYEQRERRRVFYERNGMHMTKYSYYGPDMESMFTIVSNQPEDNIEKHLVHFAKTMVPVFAGDLDKLRFYITESLRMRDLVGDC